MNSWVARRYKWLIFTVTVILALTVIVFAAWKPICLQYQLSHTESLFRASHSKSSTIRFGINDLDWIYYFEGRCGLPTIKRLATDKSISEEGQEKLTRMALFIESGGHISYFKSMRTSSMSWPSSAYADYILSRNTDRSLGEGGQQH